MKFFLGTTLLLITGILPGSAQDKIYKKDKSVITCKVIDIGINEVKYKELDIDDGPSISIAVDQLIKVVLSNGRVIEFENPLHDPNSYVDDKKKALKLHFLSPLLEHLSFSFEKSIKPGRSFESTIGFIGLGFDTDIDSKSKGVALSGGYKFMRTPDFYIQRYKYAHILKGGYVKPELLISVYSNEYDTYSNESRTQDIIAGALMINLGKQVVYDNIFVIDYAIGLGYGFSNQSRRSFGEEFERFRISHYGFLLGDRTLPVAVSAKMKIGLLW